MSKALITESYLTDIANAIRSKAGTTSLFLPPNMAQAIRSISGGANILKGTADPTADLGEDGQIYLKCTESSATAIPELPVVIPSDAADLVSRGFCAKNYVSSRYSAVYWSADSPGVLLFGYSSEAGRSVSFCRVALTNSPKAYYWAGNPSTVSGEAQEFSAWTYDSTNQLYYYGERYSPLNEVSDLNLPFFNTIAAGRAAARAFFDSGKITAVYLKVNGAWQALIGSDVEDVSTETGGIKTRQTSAFDIAGLIESGDFYWPTSAVGELNE